MPRDAEHLRRLYGEPPPPPPVRITYGVLPVLWIVGLMGMGALSTVVALGSLWLAATSGPSPLERWEVVEPGEPELLVAPEDPGAQAGCVITPERVVRWEAQRPVGEVRFVGLSVEREGEAFVMRSPGVSEEKVIRCAPVGSPGFETLLMRLKR
jgi:hypothetical protein